MRDLTGLLVWDEDRGAGVVIGRSVYPHGLLGDVYWVVEWEDMSTTRDPRSLLLWHAGAWLPWAKAA